MEIIATLGYTDELDHFGMGFVIEKTESSNYIVYDLCFEKVHGPGKFHTEICKNKKEALECAEKKLSKTRESYRNFHEQLVDFTANSIDEMYKKREQILNDLNKGVEKYEKY